MALVMIDPVLSPGCVRMPSPTAIPTGLLTTNMKVKIKERQILLCEVTNAIPRESPMTVLWMTMPTNTWTACKG